MAERDFDKEREARIKKGGHTFTLGGEKFHTHPTLSVSSIMKKNDPDEETVPLQRTIEFLTELIVPADRERFMAMITAEDVFIDATDLLDISKWLIEVISGRPTTSPASSGNGAGRTSSGSKAKPSSRGGTTKK